MGRTGKSAIVFDHFSLPNRPLVQFWNGIIVTLATISDNPQSICGFRGSFDFFFGPRWRWVWLRNSRHDWVLSSSWPLGFEVVPLGSWFRGFRPPSVYFDSIPM